MQVTVNSTGVWLQLLVWDASDEPEELILADVLAAYVEIRQNGELIDDTNDLTLTEVADYSSHDPGNYVYEDDGVYWVAVPDVTAVTEDTEITVVVNSSSQTTVGVPVRVAPVVLTEASIRDALGMAAADMDDRLDAIDGAAEKVADAYDGDGTLTETASNELAAVVVSRIGPQHRYAQ